MAGPERAITQPVTLGRIVGLFGVRGWVKVFSYTELRDNILAYPVWWLARDERWARVAEGRRHGAGLIARLEGTQDRDAAARLVDQEILVDRAQLPPPEEGTYYWADLEGLEVIGLDGRVLGRVSHLFRTGANDVLVVQGKRERLIPFLQGDVVREVDPEGGWIRVDWDPEF